MFYFQLALLTVLLACLGTQGVLEHRGSDYAFDWQIATGIVALIVLVVNTAVVVRGF
jgi:hypothetical protein